MKTLFDKIDYSVIDKNFFQDEQIISSKTAKVILYNNGKEIDSFELGYISNDFFQNESISNQNLELNNCFFDHFPKLVGIYQRVSFTNCIFTDKSIEFRIHVKKDLNLNKSIFIADNVDFSNCIIEGQGIFSETLFKCENFKLNNADFKNGLNFKHSVFVCDYKQFEKLKVEKEEVNFTNTDFGSGNVSFQDSHFGSGRKIFSFALFGEGFVDFTRTNFGSNDVFFERTIFGDGNISFRSAHFGTGTVDFRRCEFGVGEKDFMHTNFGNGNVKFINSIFKAGKITFRLANFGTGDIDFHFATIDECDFLFEHVNSNNGTLDFRGVEITKARINFNHLNFGDGDIIFESFEQNEGTFVLKNSFFGRGLISFENVKCNNIDFYIENVDFGSGSVSFTNAEFKSINLKNTQINSYFDLRIKNCEKIDLSNSVINDVLDLNPVKTGLNVKSLYLQGVRLLGRIYLDWHNSNVKDLIYSQDTTIDEKSEQFRILKENYHSIGQYEYEDLAYVEFKRAESVSKLEKIKNKKFFQRIGGKLSHWFEWLILDKMGQYATNPLRVLVSMLVVYTLFSVIYVLLPLISPEYAQINSSLFKPDDPLALKLVAKGFYHSAVTFLTIGYGDYYPVGIIRILSGLEGFIGLFLMSYFTVAFVRKILR